MTKKIIVVCVFSFMFICAVAQEKKSLYQFHSINSLALVNGNNSVSAALQSVNGFQKKNWFAGIGAGIDYYLYRTVPVFADVRYSFGKKKNKFFAYADAGANFEWVENNDRVFIWDNNSGSKFHSGIYTDAGLGYFVKMKKNNGLVLSLGNSHKTLKETITYTDWRTGQLQTDFNSYKLNRIVIKIGWQF